MTRISSKTALFAASSLPLIGAVLAMNNSGSLVRLAVSALRDVTDWASTVLPAGLNSATGLAVALVLFFAGLASGLSGFAFSAVAACVLWLLPPLQAVPLLMLLSTCNQLLSVSSLRKEVVLLPRAEKEGAVPYIIGGLVGVPIGFALLKGLPCATFAGGLGVFLIAYSALMLFKPDSLRIALSGWKPALAVGALGGVVGGFSAFPGSIPVVYLGLRGLGKSDARGVVQPYILTLQVISLVSLAVTNGAIFNTRFWLLGAVTLPAALLGTATGVRLYRHLSDVNFRRAVLVLLAFSGVSLLAKAII
jgi:uncharacterized membrane protein YfcA